MTKPIASTNNTAQIRAIGEQCVKCGLCLPVCPTYQLHKAEAESPRGRIALAQAVAEQELADPSARTHLDSCLACGACESVCPSNVAYQNLISRTRAHIAAHRREPLLRRIVRSALERPKLSRWLNPLIRIWRWKHMPYRRRQIEDARRVPAPLVSASTRKSSLALIPGCTGDLLERDTLDAAERLFRQCGFDVYRLPARCCGALALHSGDIRRAEDLSAALREMLADSRTTDCTGIVSGCAVGYQQASEGLFQYHDPMQLLWSHRDRLRFRSDTRSVALHIACTHRTNPESVKATEGLLGMIPGLKLVTLPHRGRCCGSAGTYFLQHAQSAIQLRQPILDDLDSCKAELVLSANIGCRVQIAMSRTITTLHPLEFLDELLER